MIITVADERTSSAAVTPFEREIVAAVRDFIDKQAVADKALIKRDRVINAAHQQHGVSVRMLSPYLREILIRGGLTDSEIKAAGISEGNVRYALRAKRWEEGGDDG